MAIDLAVSVATRGGWLAFRGPQSPALFIDQALGNSALTARVRSALIAHRSSPTHASPGTPFFFTSHFHSIADPQEFEFLLSTAQSVKAGLIVFDSPFGLDLYLNRHKLHSFFPVLAQLRQLAVSANAAVLLLHDLSKHRSDLGDPFVSMGVDHVLATESFVGSTVVHLRTLASSRQSHVSIPVNARRDGTFAPAPNPSTPSDMGKAGLELLDCLKTLGEATTSELMAAVSLAVPTRVRTLIHELICDGYVRRLNPGGQGSSAIYELTPAGLALLRRP